MIIKNKINSYISILKWRKWMKYNNYKFKQAKSMICKQ